MGENIKNVIKNKLLAPLNILNNEIIKNEQEILNFYNNNIKEDNCKERVLLNFRRLLEMVVSIPLFFTVTSKTTNNIIVVREDNFLQLIDERYYYPLQLSSFLDIFKIETNNFNSLNCYGEPHIKLIVNYITSHYNTTFRKFMNRNKEYYYMYKFFFDNGEQIRKILDILNAYHYNIEGNNLFFVRIEEFSSDISTVFENLSVLFEKLIKSM